MNSKFLILFTVVVLFSACKSRNKISIEEQKLTSRILQEEDEKETLRKERTASINSKGNSNAIRLEENRSVDPQRPPVILNIPEARNKIKPVKYSELGSSVHYVLLKHPSDSLFFKHGAQILFTKSNIITSTWRGIGRFDLQGNFIEMICNDGQKFIVHPSGHMMVTPEVRNAYMGSNGKVFAIDNQIFYQYVDNPNKESFLLKYDVSPDNQTLIMPGSNEEKKMNGKGIIVSRFPNHDGNSMTTSFQWNGNNLTLLDEEHWFVTSGKFQSSKSGNFMTIHSLNGDTVCSLKEHDPLKNLTSSTYRGIESGDNYKLNGYRYFRQNFNDTIYRFEGTNRLVPVYVIDLGEKGLESSTEAITPSYSLKDKFVYNQSFETKNFLFFLYTQDYSCQNTAKNGTLKYNRFVLNKKTGEQFHAYIDAEPYMPTGKMIWPQAPEKGIINDLDFGPAQWPEEQTESGQIYLQLTGNDLKEHVQKNKSNSNTTNREQLKMLAGKCSGDDIILMIIE